MRDGQAIGKTTDRDTATVTGVVIAGVLASFTIPGPYDWGSTLIGLLLLGVIAGFVSLPHHWREAGVIAAVVAFTVILIVGRPLDLLGWDLANWPSKLDTRESLDKPRGSNGYETLLLWLGLTAVVWPALLTARRRKDRRDDTAGQRPSPPDHGACGT